jgi:hypothetical protein
MIVYVLKVFNLVWKGVDHNVNSISWLKVEC